MSKSEIFPLPLFTGYLGLFFTSFLAATIVPMPSEIGLVALYQTSSYTVLWLVVFASLGNILGAVVNWFLGRALEQYQDRRWFPANPAQLERARRFYHKYGFWSLALSWVPIIGDPITLIAGVLREPIWRFLLIVGCAKTLRYSVVAYLLHFT